MWRLMVTKRVVSDAERSVTGKRTVRRVLQVETTSRLVGVREILIRNIRKIGHHPRTRNFIAHIIKMRLGNSAAHGLASH